MKGGNNLDNPIKEYIKRNYIPIFIIKKKIKELDDEYEEVMKKLKIKKRESLALRLKEIVGAKEVLLEILENNLLEGEQ